MGRKGKGGMPTPETKERTGPRRRRRKTKAITGYGGISLDQMHNNAKATQERVFAEAREKGVYKPGMLTHEAVTALRNLKNKGAQHG